MYGSTTCLMNRNLSEKWQTSVNIAIKKRKNHSSLHVGKLYVTFYTSSTAQGGGGSFKNRKSIGEIGCCESRMAERIHWWTERCLRSPHFLSLSLTIYLPTYLPTYLSIYLSLSLSLYLSICLAVCLSICLPVYLWCSVIQCSVV